MNKYDEILNEYKSMFPEDIEAIILTKEKYDEMLGIREYENIILRDRIDKAIEYIEQCEWEDYDDDTPAEEKLYSINVLKLLDILKGE